jgi:3-isopropylmalate dehydrogenase
LFERVHGSAPDIAGRGKADPTAAVLSVSMLLAHAGEAEASARVEAAVAADLASRDPKQPGSTAEIGERLAKAAAG